MEYVQSKSTTSDSQVQDFDITEIVKVGAFCIIMP